MKQIIRLTEGELKMLIMEAVNEYHSDFGWLGIQADEEDWVVVNQPQSENDTAYAVKLWCGSGYMLDLFKVYAHSDEEALERVVAYLDKTNDNRFFDDVYYDERFAELKAEGASDEEIDDEFDSADDYYVDATMEGASQPHWVRGENRSIQKFPDNGKSVNENASKNIVQRTKAFFGKGNAGEKSNFLHHAHKTVD